MPKFIKDTTHGYGFVERETGYGEGNVLATFGGSIKGQYSEVVSLSTCRNATRLKVMEDATAKGHTRFRDTVRNLPTTREQRAATPACTPHENKMIASFLRELSRRHGADGCNDMTLQDNADNRALVAAAYKGLEDIEPTFWRGKIIVYNHIILGYLMEKFMVECGLTRNNLNETTE